MTPARRSSRARASSVGRFLASLAFVLVPPTLSLGAVHTWTRSDQVGENLLAKTEVQQHWDIAARIYSDTYSVYPGLRVDTQGFRKRIERLGYSSTGGTPSRRGTYSFSRSDGAFAIYLHAFDYPGHPEPGHLIRMRLDESGRIISMRIDGDREISEFELEPALLSGAEDGSNEQRQVYDLEQFPPKLVRAVPAIEEGRCFGHAGLDVPGLSHALALNVTSSEMQRGDSTPTGQLMKGLLPATDCPAGRSVREPALAPVAERHISESAIRDIDVGGYQLALDEPLEASARDAVGIRAPYFVDFVSRELAKRYPASVLQGQGFRVFTTLDPEMQVIAESVVADNVVEMEHDIGDALAKAGQPLQAALVVLDPRSGAIRAMVGGRDSENPQFNRAIDMRRQPGSTFKPIVALAAIGSEQVGAKHFKTTTQVMDERMQWEWQGTVWSPRNYEGEFYGLVTVREAIEHSLNSAVARIAKDVGVKPIRDLAVRLGMTSDLGVYPSIVLGGQPVPLLDMAKVFSVFATGGMKRTPVSVHSVTDASGHELEGSPVETKRVIPATDAYLVTHLLEGVMERGTGATARRKGFKHPAAGKTGTSNDYKDAWFVGFTPNLLAAVWVGFDEAASMGMPGSEAALPIWTDFMRQALADTPHDSFDVPPGIVLVDVDKKNGEIARPECPKQVREAFLAGEEPHQMCSEHGGEWR